MSTDVATIDKDLADCAYEINLLGKQLAHRMLELGKWCAKARDLHAQKRDGSFAAWVEANCDVSLGYCYGAIRCYETLGDCNGCKIDVRAMLLLSSKGVPQEARDAAIEAAESGEQVTTTKAQELIREHRMEVVHDTHGEPNDGQRTSDTVVSGKPARVSSVATDSAGDDRDDVDGGSDGSGDRSTAEQDGCLDGEHGEALHASGVHEAELHAEPQKGKATKADSNLIGDAIRQITMEAEFATEGLADFQVQAIYEGVRLWMAADLEKRGIKS